MKIRLLLITVLTLSAFQAFALQSGRKKRIAELPAETVADSVFVLSIEPIETPIDITDLLNSNDSIDSPKKEDNTLVNTEIGVKQETQTENTIQQFDSLIVAENIIREHPDTIRARFKRFSERGFKPFEVNERDHIRNPLYTELIYMGFDLKKLNWREKNSMDFFFHERPNFLVRKEIFAPQNDYQILSQIRKDARAYIANNAAGLYATTFDKLPKIAWNTNQTIDYVPVEHIQFNDSQVIPHTPANKLPFKNKKITYWQTIIRSSLQFSQIAVSENWHQGGNNHLTVLGAFGASINYDNKKKIKWENGFEWRLGYYTVVKGDDIKHTKMPNDDVVKLNSKVGLKAKGNFYYSSSLEAQTQIAKNYKSAKSDELKAKFLTPVRVNIGVGMDYKYKDLISVAVSPLAFKYVYANDTLDKNIDVNQFAIKKGENQLKEFGSKFIVTLKSYRPIQDLKIDSKLYFYTNYEKVEIDWEVVAELTINRFFSTRLMFNPRYDNTVIMKGQEKAKIQMKEMVTVGFSYRFL